MMKKEFWLHFAVGCIAAWLTFTAPPVGIVLSAWFALYQLLEGVSKDILWGCLGYGLVASVMGILV